MVTSLQFPLEVEDGWPPVGSECLPFGGGGNSFELLTAPLFVKGLSSGDVIEVTLNEGGFVQNWNHVIRSSNTTIWLLRMDEEDKIDTCLGDLRSAGCNAVVLDQIGCYAVDVPSSVSINDVDEIIAMLDDDAVAVAYPSMRHTG